MKNECPSSTLRMSNIMLLLLARFVARRRVGEIVMVVVRVGERRRILYGSEVARSLRVVSVAGQTSGVFHASVEAPELRWVTMVSGFQRRVLGVLSVLGRYDGRARWNNDQRRHSYNTKTSSSRLPSGWIVGKNPKHEISRWIL